MPSSAAGTVRSTVPHTTGSNYGHYGSQIQRMSAPWNYSTTLRAVRKLRVPEPETNKHLSLSLASTLLAPDLTFTWYSVRVHSDPVSSIEKSVCVLFGSTTETKAQRVRVPSQRPSGAGDQFSFPFFSNTLYNLYIFLSLPLRPYGPIAHRSLGQCGKTLRRR
jgi:hypothetical protein